MEGWLIKRGNKYAAMADGPSCKTIWVDRKKDALEFTHRQFAEQYAEKLNIPVEFVEARKER